MRFAASATAMGSFIGFSFAFGFFAILTEAYHTPKIKS
jgi:hypothetical protein